MSQSIHPAFYFGSIGILSNAQVKDARDYALERSDLYTFKRDLFAKRTAGSSMLFNSADCASFIDWVFDNRMEHVPRIAAFIRVVCKKTAATLARRHLRSTHNYRDAIAYHADYIGVLLATMLYGGCGPQVVRAESLTDGGTVRSPMFRLKDGRYRMAYNDRPVMVLNGHYMCWWRDEVMLAWPIISEGYVCITPSGHDGIFKLNARTVGKKKERRFVPALSYWNFSVAIVASRALSMDLGHLYDFENDALITEVRDSRNDRRSIHGFWNLSQLIRHAEKSGQFTAFEILVVRIIFGQESEGILSDALTISKRSWYRLKKDVETRFTEWARRIIED